MTAQHVFEHMRGRSEKHPRGWFRWHGKLYTESGLMCLAEQRWAEMQGAGVIERQPRTYDPDWETLRPKLERANKRFARAMQAMKRGKGKRA